MEGSLLRDIFQDDIPSPTTVSDDEQYHHANSNEESSSPQVSVANTNPAKQPTSRESSTTVTPKRPVPRPRAFRHRKIIKATKTNPTNSGSMISELQKTNATMLELADKVKKAEKRLRNMEKKVKCSPNSTSPSLKNIVPIGIRVRLIFDSHILNHIPICVLQKETRRIYKLLLDEDSENFPGWKIEPGYDKLCLI